MAKWNRYFAKPTFHLSFCWGKGLKVSQTTMEGTPRWMRGMRLLFAADFHLRESVPDAALERLVELMRRQQADMLLFGGDFAESRDQQDRMFRALSALRPPLGMFCCPGNNDWECFPNRRAMRGVVTRAGGHLLVNRACSIALDGGVIVVAGLDECKFGQPRLKGLLPPANQNRYRILLSHYPVLPEESGAQWPDLMLSGHTHGGQLNALGITPYTLPWMERRQMPDGPLCVSGQICLKDMRLLVSNGIGWSRLPLRVCARPQIHLLNFD